MYRQTLHVPVVLISSAASCVATTYFTVDEVKKVIFPGCQLEPMEVTLSADQKAAIEKASGSKVRITKPKVWKVKKGGSEAGFLVVDEVIGKHEFITYAVGLDGSGCVLQVEVMDYRESYGGEIRSAAWRKQFVGKTPASPITLNQDIRNVTGATLSCDHVTEGIKRIVATYSVCLHQ